MYDVANLQKASTILQLEKINQDLLEPYQQKVEGDLRERHKTKEIFTWEGKFVVEWHELETKSDIFFQ